MQAVVVDPTLLVRKGRERAPKATVELTDVPWPTPPAPGWVVVRPLLSGICASDLALLEGRPSLGPRTAYMRPGRVIPGHEVVGVVESTYRTRHAKEGIRVILEPRLRCRHKGLPECARCKGGEGHLCENRDRSGPICGGQGIGMSTDTGGGWSEAIIAHEEMLLPALDLSDQRAVLAEPTATALHAVSRWQRRGDRAVVIGSGSRSRLVVAVLARQYPDLDITVIYDARREDRGHRRLARARRVASANQQVDFSGEITSIQQLGAHRVWRASTEQLLDDGADLLGARRLRTVDPALPVLDRGFDVVFDCRTTESSIDLGMRLLRAGGSLVVLGRPGQQWFDWSLVADRELSVLGASGHGHEKRGSKSLAIAREWLADENFAVDSLVTHRFPLQDYERALAMANGGPMIGAVKVVLHGTTSPIETRAEVHNDDELDETPILGAIAARIPRNEEDDN